MPKINMREEIYKDGVMVQSFHLAFVGTIAQLIAFMETY